MGGEYGKLALGSGGGYSLSVAVVEGLFEGENRNVDHLKV